MEYYEHEHYEHERREQCESHEHSEHQEYIKPYVHPPYNRRHGHTYEEVEEIDEASQEYESSVYKYKGRD